MTNLTNYIEYANDLNGEIYIVHSCNPETGIYDVADVVSDPRAAMDIVLAEQAKGFIANMRATYGNQEAEEWEAEVEWAEARLYEDWTA